MNSSVVSGAAAKMRAARRAEKRREQIFEMASQLFAQHGVEATTLDMIAEELRNSRAFLYHYVKSKEKILTVLYERYLRDCLQVVLAAVSDRLPLSDRLQHLIEAHIGFVCSRSESQYLLPHDTAFGAETAVNSPAIVALHHEYETMVRDLIAEGIQAGLFRAPTVDVAVTIVLSILWSPSLWDSARAETTPEQIGEQVAALLLQGLSGSSTTDPKSAPGYRGLVPAAPAGR